MKKKILENALSLGMALLLVLVIRSSVIEAYKIPSGSMIPTLLVGDHIFVNKFAYGLKFPMLEWFIDKPVFIFKREPPQRGDIIVFKYPLKEELYYIKRVVGIPGDTIDWRGKQLYVNSEPVKRKTLPLERSKLLYEDIDTRKYNVQNLEIFDEALGKNPHLMMIDDTHFFGDNRGPWRVPAASYFVMGDNRDHSNDSRFWGFVPEKNIKGKAFVIWASFWVDFSDWQNSVMRPSRTGTMIQ